LFLRVIELAKGKNSDVLIQFPLITNRWINKKMKLT